MNIRKLMSWLLVITIMCSLCVPVWAVDDSESTDYTSGTEIKYVGTGSESYTVAVPAQLAPGDSGTVTLNGTWASNRVVTVSTNDNVQMVNNINENDVKNLDVTFEEIRVAGDNTSSISATSDIAVAEMTGVLFGTWEGFITYSVEAYDRLPLALCVKYLSSGGYCLIDIQNNVHLYDNQDNLLGMIPAMCIEINGMNFTIANTGTEYDGTYRTIEGGNYVVMLYEYGEENLILIKDGCCSHNYGMCRNLYDSEMNEVSLNDITDIKEFKSLTLRCPVCLEEIPMRFFDDSDYIYVYNTFMEPKYNNGELLDVFSPDMWNLDYTGWFAIPFDIAKTNNLYTEIEGMPVTATWLTNNMIIPTTIKNAYHYNFDEVTYLGTEAMFEEVLWNINQEQSFIDWLQQHANGLNETYTIHCSDGDLIIQPQ